jgi:DNA-binding transcriptional regulator YdaS (Cro superfamily)
MTLAQWLSAESGRTSEMALRFGITLSAVSQWRDNGVPVDRMAEVSQITGGAVTIEDMVIERSSRRVAA